MTDCEKTEMLARWMGYTPSTWDQDRGVQCAERAQWCRWWHPLHNVANAMEVFERLVDKHHTGTLLGVRVDGGYVYRCDICISFGPECATIPAAICEAVVEWLEEKGE